MLKRLFTNLGVLLCVLAVLEGISFMLHGVLLRETYSYASIDKKIEVASQDSSENIGQLLAGGLTIPHPYLGYVYDPRHQLLHQGIGVSQYGFVDDKPPIQTRSPEKVIVGIFGGSVAWWLQAQGERTMKEELQKVSYFQNKEIVFVRLALGAYKQPQQLQALSYILALGGEFDIIVNIDGYNEVALVNFNDREFPFYPQYWTNMLKAIPDRKEMSMVGKIENMKECRINTAKKMQSFFLRRSVTAGLFWTLYDRYLGGELNALRTSFSELGKKTDEDSPAAFGPLLQFSSKLRFERKLASVWEQSSLMMNEIAKAHGIRYFHFLQPNQYVPHSKVLTAEEKTIAYAPKSYPALNVVAGYPYLLRRGDDLKSKGVEFFDATKIFKDVQERMYNDDCCHLSEEGNAIFGRFVGRSIAEAMAATPAVAAPTAAAGAPVAPVAPVAPADESAE